MYAMSVNEITKVSVLSIGISINISCHTPVRVLWTNCINTGWSKTASMKGRITVWGNISGLQRQELHCIWKTHLLF